MASKFVTKKFWNSCASLFQVPNICRMNTRRFPSVLNAKEKKARGLMENNNAVCNLTYSHSCLCRGIPECLGYVTPLVDCEMNYHVQYLLRHFERDTQAGKSGGIFYPPPSSSFGDVIHSQCFLIQLLIASVTIFSHNSTRPYNEWHN